MDAASNDVKQQKAAGLVCNTWFVGSKARALSFPARACISKNAGLFSIHKAASNVLDPVCVLEPPRLDKKQPLETRSDPLIHCPIATSKRYLNNLFSLFSAFTTQYYNNITKSRSCVVTPVQTQVGHCHRTAAFCSIAGNVLMPAINDSYHQNIPINSPTDINTLQPLLP